MKNHNISVALGCAHGIDVPGKQSPDGTFHEWMFSREIQFQVADILKSCGYEVYLVNAQDTEMGLSNRKRYLNQLNPVLPLVYITLHNNAAGNEGKWLNATGIEVYSTRGETKSDKIATLFFELCEKDFPEFTYRKDLLDGDPDKEANFTELMSKWPSILIEWLFMDSKKDIQYLKDDGHKQKLVNFLVDFVNTLDMKYHTL